MVRALVLFFLNRSVFFLRAASDRRFVNRNFCRRVGGADRDFLSIKKAFRRDERHQRRRFFFFARANERERDVRSKTSFDHSERFAPEEKTRREASEGGREREREREEGARKGEEKKLLKASFFPSFFARII